MDKVFKEMKSDGMIIMSSKCTDDMIWFNPTLKMGFSGDFDCGGSGTDHEAFLSYFDDCYTDVKSKSDILNKVHINNWYRIIPETKTILKRKYQKYLSFNDYKVENY